MALRVTSLLVWVVIIFTGLVTSDVDPVVIKGSHFFYQNGSEFFVRGVTYQQPSNSTPVDPLAVLTCMRDIPFLTQLTTNVIRVSYIDPTQDHTACMTALSNAGIYVLVDLPGTNGINSTNPEWNLDMYNSWTQKIDAVAGHNNVLGFFAGNNIVTNSSNSPAAAFLKASIRDLKSYIKGKYNRPIPVGYELNMLENYDVVSLYMACGNNASDSIDFLGISDFNTCSNSESSFDLVSVEYASYPVPVFFADYGCKDAPKDARDFEEVAEIYGNPMVNVTSGGIVFEYFPDEQDLGLVTVVGTQVTPLPDFTSYSSQIAKITPFSTHASDYIVTNTVIPSCPTGAAFSASPTLPPKVNEPICACMKASFSCVAKTGLSSSTVASALENICGSNSENCPALHGNGSNGTYGAFSMCSDSERLTWALGMQYRENEAGCQNDENAEYQSLYLLTSDCEEVMMQAGNSGTGTITTYPTATNSSTVIGTSSPGSVHYDYSIFGFTPAQIAGISVGSVFIFLALVGGSVWFFCMRRRRRLHNDKSATLNDNGADSQSENLDEPNRLRGGRTSLLSNDSLSMSELPPFDGSYMSHSMESRSEASGQGRHESERNVVATQEDISPISQHSNFEIPRKAVATPSPMSSVKELPAFRTQMEDKSLASMKLLSPVVKVSPIQYDGKRHVLAT